MLHITEHLRWRSTGCFSDFLNTVPFCNESKKWFNHIVIVVESLIISCMELKTHTTHYIWVQRCNFILICSANLDILRLITLASLWICCLLIGICGEKGEWTTVWVSEVACRGQRENLAQSHNVVFSSVIGLKS